MEQRHERVVLAPSLRVLLWSAPRCLSSVFERSVRRLKGVKVIYEPHQQAYYYGPDRKMDNGNNPTQSEIDLTATFQAADEQLLQSYEGYRALFAKNHAYFVEGNYKHYTEGRFASYKHTFLIRNPHRSIPSYVDACKRSGFTSTPDDNGIKQLFEFFETVRLTDHNPIVIDADDLLMHPKEVMEQYCCATGVPFDEDMLTWTPGVVEDWTQFAHYKDWHENAMMSSGFVKPTATQPATYVHLSEEVEDAVHKALPFYEAMYHARMKVVLS